MHATVRALEQEGAVKRSLPGHGHAARLEVTEHGQQLLAKAGAAAERLDQELFSGLSEQDRDALRLGLMALVPAQARGSAQTSDKDGS